MLGVVTIVIAAGLGASLIWFGWRGGAAGRIAGGRGRGRGALKGGLTGLSAEEGELIKNSLNGWYTKYGEKLPEAKQIGLPVHAEPFIIGLAVRELSDEKEPETDGLAKRLESELTPHGAAVLALATADVIPKSSQNDLKPLIDSYKYAHRQVTRHDELGAARYYVPRTPEGEILAAFSTRKLWRRKSADEKTFANKFTDDDKKYLSSIIELLARSWKTAHSFRARMLPEQAKLILCLLFCEKAGKRRFGNAKIRIYDTLDDDEELDHLDELLEMFNQTWKILQFEEYKSKSTESKIISAIITYEKLGAARYLNRYKQGEESR
jgi:hypothetical protein